MRIALLDQQPVTVHLEQAVPFATIIAIGIEGDGPLKLRHRPGTIALLGIGLPQRSDGFAVLMIFAYGILQCANRRAALARFHGRQPAGTLPKCRVSQLFLLCIKLLARRHNRIPFTEHAQETFESRHAFFADGHALNLLIPEIGCGIAPGVVFRHLLKNGIAFFVAPVGDQQPCQCTLQIGISRIAAIKGFQLSNGFVVSRRDFRHLNPVFRRQIACWRTAVKHLLVSGNGLLRMPCGGL